MLAGVEIIVGAVAVISLGFAVPISYFVDVLSDMVVACVITGFVPGIGVEMLADANVNVFAFLMTVLEFAAPTPLREFGC